MEKTENDIRMFTKCMINNSLKSISKKKITKIRKGIKVSKILKKKFIWK